jgi:hypothetical protein
MQGRGVEEHENSQAELTESAAEELQRCDIFA